MDTNLSDEQIKLAKKRAKDKIEFFSHLATYLFVNSILFTINMVTIVTTDSDNVWFFWVAIFWGFGLFMHFISVFVFDGIFGDLQGRLEANEMKKIAKRGGEV